MADETLRADHTPFAGHLKLGVRPALLMVDLVRAYFETGGPFFLGSDNARHSALNLLSRAREADIPVIHTRVSYSGDGLDGGQFIRKVPSLKVFLEPSYFGEFVPELSPLPAETVVTKQYASAFFGTSLVSTLGAQGIDTLVIAGVSTSGCIRATAVDALQHGFVPLVVRDAVGDRDASSHENNLYDIQAKYGEVCDEEAAIRYLVSCGSAVKEGMIS